MSDSPTLPLPYRVSYTERVRNDLRHLLGRARERGPVEQVIAAVVEIDRLLRIYPQFGQPLRNLNLEAAQLWIGVVPPLVVHYVLNEQRRLVIVAVPIVPLRQSDF